MHFPPPMRLNKSLFYFGWGKKGNTIEHFNFFLKWSQVGREG